MRHRFHSMCPYFAMFPESFARFWIEALTEPGDTVLDPFAGRGTAPFEALLLGRVGVGVDINPVAACLNKAKLTPPQSSTLERRLRDLEKGYDGHVWEAAAEQMPEFFLGAYHLKTLGQLLYLRRHLKWQERRSDAMISALVLGGLHGEVSSRMYLSNQMPRTISTKPAYSLRFWEERNLVAPYRDAFSMLRHAAGFRYKSPLPKARGRALFGDFRSVRWAGTGVAPNLIITSPPYGAVTSYEEDQWLRLWFLGGPERPGKAQVTRDDRHRRAEDYWRFIADFWRMAAVVLAPGGSVVMRVGASGVSADHFEGQLQASVLLCPRESEVVSISRSAIAKRQTEAFNPGSRGCLWEIDMHVKLS